MAAQMDRAPLPGKQNALKHGRFTRKAIEDRPMIRELIKEANAHINDIEASW